MNLWINVSGNVKIQNEVFDISFSNCSFDFCERYVLKDNH